MLPSQLAEYNLNLARENLKLYSDAYPLIAAKSPAENYRAYDQLLREEEVIKWERIVKKLLQLNMPS